MLEELSESGIWNQDTFVFPVAFPQGFINGADNGGQGWGGIFSG